jgi:hypothetical protein
VPGWQISTSVEAQFTLWRVKNPRGAEGMIRAMQGRSHRETVVQTDDEPGLGWTVVLRRQTVRIVESRPEDTLTGSYEIVCCDCGDDPDLDYRDVSPELQRVRGPHTFSAGIAAYVTHVGRLHG